MKRCIDCKVKPRYVRPDGKELERCYDCAKKWCAEFDRILTSPEFVKSIDKLNH